MTVDARETNTFEAEFIEHAADVFKEHIVRGLLRRQQCIFACNLIDQKASMRCQINTTGKNDRIK